MSTARQRQMRLAIRRGFAIPMLVVSIFTASPPPSPPPTTNHPSAQRRENSNDRSK